MPGPNPKTVSKALILMLFTCAFAQDDEYLTLKALGRPAHLGFLYDARKERLLDFSVFKESLPATFVQTLETPFSVVKTSMANTYKQKFSLFDINASLSASVLSGMLTIKGSAQFLQSKQKNSKDVTGALLLDCRTVTESLQLYYTDLKNYFNNELIAHTEATHIVTGISWGANVVVIFKDTVTDEKDETKIAGSLEIEFNKLKGVFQISGDIHEKESNETSAFAISVQGDLQLPDQVPTTYEEVAQLIKKVPQLISSTRGEKGVPLEFTLTPIGRLKSFVTSTAEKPNLPPSNAHKIDEWVLQKLVDIYDDISMVEQQLNDLTSLIFSNKICITPQTKANLSQLLSDFDVSKLKFKHEFNSKLVNVRSGQQLTTVLSDLAQAYNENKFNTKNVLTELVKFDVALQKIRLYNVFKHANLSIEYFGSNNDCATRVQENLENIIYVLFQKQQFAQNNPKTFTSNMNTFLTTLSKPFNKRFVVDCDFSHTECATIRETTIKQILKGQTTFNDVNFEMQKATVANPLKLKAIGRFVQIGELYDIRKDEFTGRSILNSNSSADENLKTLTGPFSETIIVSSRRYQDKFKALNIDPQQQFSILINIAHLTRSGLYLNPQEDEKEIASIVCIQRLSESELKINDEAFLSSLDFTVALKPSATHFVSKIEYGFNTIFSVQDDDTLTANATKLRDYLNSLKSTILQLSLNSNMKDSNATTQPEYKHTLQPLHYIDMGTRKKCVLGTVLISKRCKFL